MATEQKKILLRRGNKADLVIADLQPGEPCLALDTNEIGVKTSGGIVLWFATLDANGKAKQDPASYGQANGAALNPATLPTTATLVKLNPDGTLSLAVKNVDYAAIESGTFTPSLKGTTTAGAFTYHSQLGQYTVTGNMVNVQIYLKINAITTAASGDLILAGLPKIGTGSVDRADVVGRIGGTYFHGVVSTVTGQIYLPNCTSTVSASILQSLDGFCCSISYRC
jgi:hypothetical protein